MKLMLNKILLGILVFINLYPRAQIVTKSITKQEAIKQFVGGAGIEIISVNFSGQANQLGAFTFPNHADESFDMEEGIILCNGNVKNLEPSARNNQAQGDVYWSKLTGSGNDPDLEALSQKLAGFSNQDKGVLQIEFKSIKSGQMEFEFIFGSHEYPLFAPDGDFGDLNKYDVFAFLLKGSGIQPDLNATNTANFYPGGYKNLALVPGTNDPISVSTICSTCTYKQYFHKLDDATSNNITLGGITTKIKVTFNVQCGETYTMKFAIADVGDNGDGAFDSYVFFNAKSFVGQGDIGEIIVDDGPYCQGSAYNLSITGSDDYQYLWSNGATSKQTTIVANSTDQQYWVTITDPITNCSITKYGKLGHVYINQNQAPYSKGMDHQNEFVRYVQAEKEICFDVGGFDRQADELVRLDVNSKPTNSVVTGDIAVYKPNPIVKFCWTPQTGNIGENLFIFDLKDNNACNNLSNKITLKIIVICPNCVIDVYIENRSKNGNPIAKKVVAANWIEAGNSVDASQPDGDVIIDDGEKSEFKAGKKIRLMPGFKVLQGGEFKAIVEPVCIDPNLCETCCDQPMTFSGKFSNVFVLGEDIWEVVDFVNPDCAYNITGFKLQIFDMRNFPNDRVYVQEDLPSSGGLRCCRYQSKRFINDQTRISSIHWDGVYNDSHSGRIVDDADIGNQYVCKLDIFDCNHNSQRIDFVILIIGPAQLGVQEGTNLKEKRFLIDSTQSISKSNNLKDTSTNNIQKTNTRFNNSKPEFIIFPNPNEGIIYLDTYNWPDNFNVGNIIIFDEYGRTLKKFEFHDNNTKFDISDLSNGTYYAKIEVGGYSDIKKIIIQK